MQTLEAALHMEMHFLSEDQQMQNSKGTETHQILRGSLLNKQNKFALRRHIVQHPLIEASPVIMGQSPVKHDLNPPLLQTGHTMALNRQ